MSVLETMVAVRDTTVEAATHAIVALCAEAGVTTAGRRPADTRDGAPHDVLVYDASGPWIVVRPHYIVGSDDLAVALTARLGGVATAISIYEDVFWTHHVARDGRLLDQFCNLPGYFGPGEHGPEWRGKPDVVSDVLGVDRQVVAPYLRQWSNTRARLRSLLPWPPRPRPGDQAHALDGWVTLDLWCRIGIEVNDGEMAAALVPLTDDESSALGEHLAARRAE